MFYRSVGGGADIVSRVAPNLGVLSKRCSLRREVDSLVGVWGGFSLTSFCL